MQNYNYRKLRIKWFSSNLKSGIAGLLLLPLMAVSCADHTMEPIIGPEQPIEDNKPWVRQEPIKPDLSMRKEIEGLKRTGFETFSQLWNESSKTGNFVFSPLSVYGCVSLLATGADGEKADELLRFLNVERVEDLNLFNQKIIHNFPFLDEKVDVRISNSLWSHTGITLNQDYIGTLSNYYDAECFSRDFSNVNIVDEVNSWISAKTAGKITNLLSKGSITPPLSLVNAVFFSGSWSEKFDKEETTECLFKLSDGSEVPVNMMKGVREGKYVEGLDACAFTLTFNEGLFDMTFILPNENISLSQFISNLSCDKLDDFLNSGRYERVDLRIPRFDCSSDFLDFKSTLKAMGLSSVFNVDSWPAITESMRFSVGDMVHSVSFRIDENGGEGAAATVILMSGATDEPYTPPAPIPFNLNRPFLFIVNQTTTQVPLFMGAVLHP